MAQIGRYKAEPITKAVDWTRSFEAYDDDGNIIVDYDDIIAKKLRILKVLKEDPDLLTIMGKPEVMYPREGATEEEIRKIADRNCRISEPEIIPWLKINGTITTVSNKVLFDIETERESYDNPAFSRQYLRILCLADETSMDTEYGIPKVDLMAYIVKDLLNRSDFLGVKLVLHSDTPRIIDDNFYCRELLFAQVQPNFSNSMKGGGNRYDNHRFL